MTQEQYFYPCNDTMCLEQGDKAFRTKKNNLPASFFKLRMIEKPHT
jgi:hypothetical protein